MGLFIPSCDEHGNYEAKQCHGSTGHCWCVDQQTGSELFGTRRGPTQGSRDLNCNESPPEEPLKKEGENCGPCYCPPTYTAGECEPGLECVSDPTLADAPGICQLPDLNRQKECEKECFGVRVCRRSIGCGEKEYDKCMGKCLSSLQVIDLTKTDGPSFGLVLPPCMSELQNSEAGSEPQCTGNGYYKPQQCLPARREWDMMFPPECQCVHYETGEEINGTKCRPEEKDCDKVDCNKFQDCNEDTEVFSTCGSSCADKCRDGKVVMAGACNFMCEEGCFCREGYIHDTRTGECILEKECKTEQESAVGGAPAPVDVGPCLKLLQTARFAPGAEPKCTESGDFAPQKCQLILSGAWTSRFCWCQNSQTGDEIKGTRRGPGEKNVDCTIYHPEDDIEVIEGPKPSTVLILPPCIEKRLKADENENGFEFALEVGPFIPKCSKSGDFEARQCIKDGEFSTCWCVNIKTGKEIPGTRYIRSPGFADANNCTEINGKLKRNIPNVPR